MNRKQRLQFASKYLIDPACLTTSIIDKDFLSGFDDFKFSLAKSRGDSPVSTKDLLYQITKACEKSFVKPGLPVLLLSSGKDSLALALGYAEMGESIQCLSLVSDEEERNYVKQVCNMLGHKVKTVDARQLYIARSYFDEVSLFDSDLICLDQALYAMYIAVKTSFGDDKLNVIDGMGNDIYFGHIPARYQLRSNRLSVISKISPRKLSFYLRDFTAAMGLRTSISYFDRNFETIETEAMFDSVLHFRPKSGAFADILNARAYLRGKYIDNFVYAEKTRSICKTLSLNYSFPWMDSDLSEFCFNLPDHAKYDYRTLTNKILLRQLLDEKINYNRPKKGIDLFLQYSYDQIKNILNENQQTEVTYKHIISDMLLPEHAKKRALFELLLISKHNEML